MAKIGFHLNMSKKDKNGFVPIRAKISVESKARYKAIDKVKPGYWNSKKQRVRPNRENEPDSQSQKINNLIEDCENNAKAFFRDCTTNKIKLTIDLVEKFFNGESLSLKTTKKDFWEAYEEFFKVGELTLSPNSIRSRKSKKKKLKEFQNDTGYKMTFQSIDLEFFDKLNEYILFTKEHEYNYLPAITRQLKAFMNWSFERNYHSNTIYKKFSAIEKEGSIIHLTEAELKLLINFQFESEKMNRVRDFYCFGCLIGARFSDLRILTKDNISDGKLKFTTEKTKIDIAIPLFPELLAIISRYPDQYRLLPKYSGQKMCDYIKIACELAGINTPTEYKSFKKNETIKEFFPKHKLIGTHTAHKTFICLAHAKGVDIKTIMDITGIKDQNTLRRYLDVSIDTKKDNLTKMFENLTPKPETKPNEETLKALKDALAKAGFNAENIDGLFK